jgi:hypothetical protein
MTASTEKEIERADRNSAHSPISGPFNAVLEDLAAAESEFNTV